MANVPNTTTSGQVLTSVGDGSNASKWGTVTSGGGGGSGITQLTGDVTAGPGSGSVASTLAQIQGITLNASGGSAPTTGSLLGYTNIISPSWNPMGGVPTAGSILTFSGAAWGSTPAPTADAQILIWNNTLTTPAWVNKSLSQDVTITNAGVSTVNSLQNFTLNASGSNAPLTGSILGYSTAFGGTQWLPMGGATYGPTTGSINWWNSIAWQNTSPAVGYLYWNGSAYSYTTPGGGGTVISNDASGTPTLSTTAITVGTSSTAIQNVGAPSGFSTYFITYNFAQNNTAPTGIGTIYASLYDATSATYLNGSSGQPIGIFTTTTKNTYSGSLVYTFSTPKTTAWNLYLYAQTNTNTVYVAFGNISVIGIA